MQRKNKNGGCDLIATNSAWRRRKPLLAQAYRGRSAAIFSAAEGSRRRAFRVAALFSRLGMHSFAVRGVAVWPDASLLEENPNACTWREDGAVH